MAVDLEKPDNLKMNLWSFELEDVGEYPIVFDVNESSWKSLTIDQAKSLHQWLGQAITYLESKKKG